MHIDELEWRGYYPGCNDRTASYNENVYTMFIVHHIDENTYTISVHYLTGEESTIYYSLDPIAAQAVLYHFTSEVTP